MVTLAPSSAPLSSAKYLCRDREQHSGNFGLSSQALVLPGQTPWEGFHTNSSKAKAEQLMDEISSVRSVAVRAPLDGGFCSFAAAASCLVSKDRGSDKSWEAGGSAIEMSGGGGECCRKWDDSGR